MSPVYKLSNAGGFTSKQRYTSMLAGNPAFAPYSFESIATVTVGSGGSSSVTFSSIPNTYTHLQVRWIGRGTLNVSDVGQKVTFNSDTGTNYSNHLLRGNGSAVFVDSSTSQTSASALPRIAAASATSGIFGVEIMDILDYANTNKFKTLRCLGGFDANGSGDMRFTSAAWQSTSAITSISFSIPDGGNYAQYTQFALYGMKGA